MKRLIISFSLIIMGVFCCINLNAQSSNIENDKAINVLYFHGKQRCATCITIDKLTREVLEKDFAKELKSGKIKYSVIDISKKENSKIADKYEVTWSSLFINKKGNVNDMTKFGFSYARNSPEVFKAGIKKKIEGLLKK